MGNGSFNFKNLKQNEEVQRQTVITGDASARKKRELDEIANEALARVIETISATSESPDKLYKKQVLEDTNKIINDILVETKRNLSFGDKQRVAGYVMDEVFGYGPITPLINDPTVTEVMVNSPEAVFIERGGKIYKTEVNFRDDNHIMHTIDKIISPLGRRVDESSPMVDGRLPDGSRVNVIIPPLSIKGPTITIRKFAVDPYTLEDLIGFGTLNQDIAKILRACVRGRINIIVAGGTGSGKTTLLNVISDFIPNNERIVTIEDAAELQLKQEHVVSLESRPPNIEGKGHVAIRDLVINSLRMRPDRIIVGEVRGGEALDMLQAMNTGHDGSITTIHANNPRDTLGRLETMVMMSGMELPSRAIREQISSAINLIIFCARLTDGTRKIMKVTEIVGMEAETITLQDLYIFNQEGFDEGGNVVGKHVPTGIVPKFMDKLKAYGETIPASVFQAERRM
jgi:pilus assembly protein CpaF